MLKFYADEHVHSVIVHALRARGVDVVTVQDRGRCGTADDDLLEEALRDGRVMLTNDTDFLALATDSARRGVPFAPVVFWPQNRRKISEVVRSIIRLAAGDYESACSLVHFL